MDKMFCFQCEQTAFGTGCTERGVCGKQPDCAGLQDLLLGLLKEAAAKGADPALLADGLFTTVTNVNFDPEKVAEAARRVAAAIPRKLPPDMAGLEKLAGKYAFPPRREKLGEEVADSQELLLYGLKGMSAYLHHARRLGRTDAACDAFLVRALSALAKPDTPKDELISLAL